MSEVAQVALITGGIGFLTVLLTYWFNARARKEDKDQRATERREDHGEWYKRTLFEKRLIDDDANPGEEFVPISEMFGFRVKVENRGNSVLADQRARIELDEDAKIISVECEHAPDLGGRSIGTVIDKKDRNVCYVTFPFLNPGHSATISVQSVDNSTRHCWVTAGAEGLYYYDMARRRRWQAVYMLGVAGIFLLSAMGLAVAQRFISELDGTWTDRVFVLLSLGSYILLLAAFMRRGMPGPRVALRDMARMFRVD